MNKGRGGRGLLLCISWEEDGWRGIRCKWESEWMEEFPCAWQKGWMEEWGGKCLDLPSAVGWGSCEGLPCAWGGAERGSPICR